VVHGRFPVLGSAGVEDVIGRPETQGTRSLDLKDFLYDSFMILLEFFVRS